MEASQTAAVGDALLKPLGIIQGPAGTGKTVTITTLVYQIAQLGHRRDQILVCAPMWQARLDFIWRNNFPAVLVAYQRHSEFFPF